ncbi:OLC1v1006547C1 [Oldenlandia corymbosa var. corymbosa]|uniref:Mediator of RNA polymerase II transcription subunit 11 n=1 Tax=Oldenlandia corymbosa var. corymbosa TaxID=529605 RepID=A0AAV1DKM7_OLDCO|nr:OLC1v1006547C1 [Oldenlandia corymbosa var. corymbosa]
MDPQSQNPTIQRLEEVEKKIIRAMDLAGSVMEELGKPDSSNISNVYDQYCPEFMALMKDIQVTLRDEIRRACEYRPFEKCDYVPRISNEIACKKVEYVLGQLDDMKQTIENYHAAAESSDNIVGVP